MLTGLKAKDINYENSNWEGYEYEIEVGKKKHILRLSKNASNWKNNPFFKKNRHIIAGLLLNDNWIENEHKFIEDVDFFKTLLKEKVFPKTPKEKRDFLFLKIFESLNFEGQSKQIQVSDSASFWFYLKNFDELRFYIKSLNDFGLIETDWTTGSVEIQITYAGLNYAIELQEEGYIAPN